MPPPKKEITKQFEAVLTAQVESKHDQQISGLQSQLAHEKDARQEDRFVFIIVIVLLLDVVVFSVMPSFGGPLALLILELLVLLPLARRMGVSEIARILSRVLDRMSGKGIDGDAG